MDEEKLWQAVEGRDASFDGKFVYAVRSTRVYCRPSCRSRRPGRKQVVYFRVPDAAERAGYRPCRRCHPRLANPGAELLERACQALESGIGVADLATHLGVTAAKLRGEFRRTLGITPRQYAGELKVAAFKAEVRNGRGVTDALYSAGYGSSSRLYERAASHLGMTRRAYQKGGRGMAISYTTAACSLGRLLVARTPRGICTVSLGSTDAELETALRSQYPEAEMKKDSGEVAALVDHLAGRQPVLDLPLDLQATAFQYRVWHELRKIPYGETRTYGEIASAIGQPSAARAVARACAKNPAALVIPCHRVVPSGGATGGYRWGAARKRKLLETEAECSRKNSN